MSERRLYGLHFTGPADADSSLAGDGNLQATQLGVGRRRHGPACRARVFRDDVGDDCTNDCRGRCGIAALDRALNRPGLRVSAVGNRAHNSGDEVNGRVVRQHNLVGG